MVHCIKDVKILDRHGMGLSNETLALSGAIRHSQKWIIKSITPHTKLESRMDSA